MQYPISTHTHNFAIWTAARAAQRKFTTTANIAKAIKAAGLWQDANNPQIQWDEATFDKYHQEWVSKMIADFKTSSNIVCTYGRAAKIIAVFLKTAVVIPEKGEGLLSQFAHPPIDRILLTNLKKNGYVDRVESWTKLNKDEYFKLIGQFRKSFSPFWKVEKFWSVEDVD